MAFRNVERKPARDGVVYPYLTQRGTDGVVRVVACRKDSDLVETLGEVGQPVPAPDVELAKVP